MVRTLFHQRLERVLLEILTIIAIPVLLLSIVLESVYHRTFLLVIAAIVAVFFFV